MTFTAGMTPILDTLAITGTDSPTPPTPPTLTAPPGGIVTG
jgi:hypothetical protein